MQMTEDHDYRARVSERMMDVLEAILKSLDSFPRLKPYIIDHVTNSSLVGCFGAQINVQETTGNHRLEVLVHPFVRLLRNTRKTRKGPTFRSSSLSL